MTPRKRIRPFALLRGFALWALATYASIYGLARDPCLARGGVLTPFLCVIEDGKGVSILDLVTLPTAAMVALAMATGVVIVWRLLRKLERASGQ